MTFANPPAEGDGGETIDESVPTMTQQLKVAIYFGPDCIYKTLRFWPTLKKHPVLVVCLYQELSRTCLVNFSIEQRILLGTTQAKMEHFHWLKKCPTLLDIAFPVRT